MVMQGWPPQDRLQPAPASLRRPRPRPVRTRLLMAQITSLAGLDPAPRLSGLGLASCWPGPGLRTSPGAVCWPGHRRLLQAGAQPQELRLLQMGTGLGLVTTTTSLRPGRVGREGRLLNLLDSQTALRRGGIRCTSRT